MSDKISKELNIAVDGKFLDDDELDIPSVELDSFPERVKDIEELDIEQNVKDDWENSRENTYTLLANSQKILEGAMNMVNQVPSPRGFEILGQLIKTTQDLNNDLLNNSKTLNDIKGNGQQAETINNTQNNISISPTELLDMLEEK